MTKLENKVTNKERKVITSELKELLKEYVESIKRKVRERIIERIVEITNELYSTQKQHTKFQHDQSCYGLKKIRDLFELDDVKDFTAVFYKAVFY